MRKLLNKTVMDNFLDVMLETKEEKEKVIAFFRKVGLKGVVSRDQVLTAGDAVAKVKIETNIKGDILIIRRCNCGS